MPTNRYVCGMTRLNTLVIVGLASTLLMTGCSAMSSSIDDSTGSVAVPNVVGLYGDDAKDVLQDLSFKVDFDAVGGEMVILSSKWLVIGQTPGAGDQVARGEEVKLKVTRPEEARDFRAVRLVLDSLPDDESWKGATAKALKIDDDTVCVDRFKAATDSSSEGTPAGFVVVSFPNETLGDTQEGTCAEDGPTANSATGDNPSPNPSTDPPAEMTLGQKNAIKSAEGYLAYAGFSRSGLIDQLEFEGYSNEESTFAVDHITVNWNEQAARVAQNYLDYSSFSRQGLIDQLKFEGFSQAEAEYGVSAVGY